MHDKVNPPGEVSLEMIHKFWETVPYVWHFIRAHIALEMRESFNLTHEQFHILRRIHRGRTSVSDLAEAKHTSRPAASRAVDGLVEKGLVTRTRNPADRRNIHLALSAEGADTLQAIVEKLTVWMQEKLSVLEEDELKNCIRSMEALHKAFH